MFLTEPCLETVSILSPSKKKAWEPLGRNFRVDSPSRRKGPAGGFTPIFSLPISFQEVNRTNAVFLEEKFGIFVSGLLIFVWKIVLWIENSNELRSPEQLKGEVIPNDLLTYEDVTLNARTSPLEAK